MIPNARVLQGVKLRPEPGRREKGESKKAYGWGCDSTQGALDLALRKPKTRKPGNCSDPVPGHDKGRKGKMGYGLWQS